MCLQFGLASSDWKSFVGLFIVYSESIDVMADFLNIAFGCLVLLYLPYLFVKGIVRFINRVFIRPKLEVRRQNIKVSKRENRFKSISATDFYDWLLKEEFIKMD